MNFWQFGVATKITNYTFQWLRKNSPFFFASFVIFCIHVGKIVTKIINISDYETLDPIQEAMGVMGPWHVIIAVALSLVNFPVAWNQLSIAFLAPPANFTCLSPKPMDNYTTSRCEVAVGNDTFEKCREFEYDRSIFMETIITEVRH